MVEIAFALESGKAEAESQFHHPAGCATLGKEPDLSEPRFSYLQDGGGWYQHQLQRPVEISIGVPLASV